ncbi:unnamed protein product, partial [Amoebophrya sp. A25]
LKEVQIPGLAHLNMFKNHERPSAHPRGSSIYYASEETGTTNAFAAVRQYNAGTARILRTEESATSPVRLKLSIDKSKYDQQHARGSS